MARVARVVVAGIARHVAQRDRKSACEHDDAGNRLSVIDGSGTTPYVTNALNQYTSADGVYYQYDTSGTMIYDGHYVFDYDPENRLNKVKRFEQGPTALALACDTTLTFASGGDAQWLSQTQAHYFEGDAA